MSQAAVEQVIGRLLQEPAFRKLLAADGKTALAGYDLTEGEREGLKNIDLNDFDRTVTGLDQRISKGVTLN